MLSHQLKTPMTSLSMAVNLLREKLTTTDPSHAELLSIAAQDCSALSALVSDLIGAARGPTPGMLPRARLVDIVRLLRAALRPLAPQASEKGVTLTFTDPHAAVEAWVDPVKFPWVVTNIVGNALRYTGRGGTVEIAVSSAADHFAVSVSDTGPGIATDMLRRIFEPSIALEDVPEHGTHGLGLAIAREVVDAYGGSIEVQSQVGVGTTFRIQVPLRPQGVA
jgi:signal transduction histidine kinase